MTEIYLRFLFVKREFNQMTVRARTGSDARLPGWLRTWAKSKHWISCASVVLISRTRRVVGALACIAHAFKATQ